MNHDLFPKSNVMLMYTIHETCVEHAWTCVYSFQTVTVNMNTFTEDIKQVKEIL